MLALYLASRAWLPAIPRFREVEARWKQITVAKIATVVETFPTTVAKIGTATTETSHVSKSATVAVSGTQVVSHRLEVPAEQRGHWKQSTSAAGVRSDETEIEIRAKLESLLEASPVGTQTRLARAAQIQGGTLSKFLREGKSLSPENRARLIQTIPKFEELVGGDPAADRKRSRKTAATASPTLS